MRIELSIWLLPLLAYLMGSIPIAWIVGMLFYKKDIRKAGSGNVGATNALRLFGTTTGVVVLILDLAMGFVATFLAKGIFPEGSPWVAVCALLVIMGHVFPLFLGFKGGKGVATAGGAFLALQPLSLFFALLVFALIVALTRYVSLGSVCAALFFLFHSLWRIRAAEQADYASVVLITVVVLMIVLKHRANIVRLLQGTENKIKFSKKGKV